MAGEGGQGWGGNVINCALWGCIPEYWGGGAVTGRMEGLKCNLSRPLTTGPFRHTLVPAGTRGGGREFNVSTHKGSFGTFIWRGGSLRVCARLGRAFEPSVNLKQPPSSPSPTHPPASQGPISGRPHPRLPFLDRDGILLELRTLIERAGCSRSYVLMYRPRSPPPLYSIETWAKSFPS